MLLPIRYYGDPILRKKCRKIEEITPQIRALAADMIETCDANNGIGLAAPQVGVDLALFVVRNYIDEESGKVTLSEPQVYINPQISFVSKESCVEEEGCLSIPGIRGKVSRPVSIIIEAIDLEGRAFREEISGYNARVRLHENDHLNGVLYVDRLDPLDKKQVETALKALKKKGPRLPSARQVKDSSSLG